MMLHKAEMELTKMDNLIKHEGTIFAVSILQLPWMLGGRQRVFLICINMLR